MGNHSFHSIVKQWLTVQSGYLRHVGHARLVYFLDPKLKRNADLLRKSAFITIPHMHPGFDSKGSQSIPQRRIYLLTYVLTWVYLETAINAVSNAYADLSDRQSLCEFIMSSADARLIDIGFWRTFEGAKTELRNPWQLLRVNDLRKSKTAKAPTSNRSREPKQGQTKVGKHTSAFPRRSTDYEWVNESLTGLAPGSIVGNEPLNLLIENPTEYQFINLSVDDVLEKRQKDDPSSFGAPSDICVASKAIQYKDSNKVLLGDCIPASPTLDNESVGVSLGELSKTERTDEKPAKDSPSSRSLASPDSGNYDGEKPSRALPPLNLQFVNIFPSTYSETSEFKKDFAPIRKFKWTNEENCSNLFEEENDPNGEYQAGLDQHSSYQREFILDIQPGQQALGSQNSLERLQQARYLWKAHIGGLHEVFEKVDQNRGAWEEFVLEQPSGYWLLGCFAAIEEYHTMCPGKQNILSSFRPQAATVNWQDDFGQRREAFQKACKEYDLRQKDWIDSKRKRKNYKGILKSIEEIDESEVDIDLSSHMMIWCLNCNDQKREIWMTISRSARPCTWLDKRTVHFNKYGLDIRDESYSKCLPWQAHSQNNWNHKRDFRGTPPNFLHNSLKFPKSNN